MKPTLTVHAAFKINGMLGDINVAKATVAQNVVVAKHIADLRFVSIVAFDKVDVVRL